MDPDDICGVCNAKRDEHGDKNHEFNLDGDLKPLSKAPVDKLPVAPARPSDAAMLRLVERLIEKGVLDGPDLLYVFGGVRGPAN